MRMLVVGRTGQNMVIAEAEKATCELGADAAPSRTRVLSNVKEGFIRFFVVGH